MSSDIRPKTQDPFDSLDNARDREAQDKASDLRLRRTGRPPKAEKVEH